MRDRVNGGRRAGRALRRAALAAGLMLATLATTTSARASDYDPHTAGNPLKIVYYAVYPATLLIDYLILRPAYYIGQVEPFHTIFGTTRHPELPDPPPPAPAPAP